MQYRLSHPQKKHPKEAFRKADSLMASAPVARAEDNAPLSPKQSKAGFSRCHTFGKKRKTSAIALQNIKTLYFMKTIHLSLLCWVFALLGQTAYGQTQTVTLTTARSSGQDMTIHATSITEITVDWGDGAAVTYNTDEISGEVKGSTITISGDEFLTSLDASGCDLISIDISKAPNLLALYVGNNRLTSLAIGDNAALQELDCSHNRLSTINFRNNSALKYLDCSHNQLALLNLTRLYQLQSLICDNNHLTSVSTSNNKELRSLWCDGNEISDLQLSSNDSLASIICHNNKIANIATASEVLQDLWCSNNKIDTLNLSAATQLQTLCCDSNGLKLINAKTPTANHPFYLLSCGNNKLGLNSFFPAKFVGHYFYAPQDSICLDFESVNVKENVNLSAYIKNASGTNVGTITLYNGTTGEQLRRGISASNDVYYMNGNAKFWKPIDKVYFVVTADQYPDITFTSTLFSVADPTGIAAIKTDNGTDDNTWYDLQGRKVKEPGRGIYIQKGKKVLVKP